MEAPRLVASRKIVLAFVATFLVGAIAGGLLVWDFTDTTLSGFIKKTSDPDTMAATIDQKNLALFHLTPDQVAATKPMTRAFTQRLYELRNQFAQDVMAAMADYHAKVAAQMTPAQQAVYAKANADRAKRMSALLFLNQSSPPAAQK